MMALSRRVVERAENGIRVERNCLPLGLYHRRSVLYYVTGVKEVDGHW